jgi:hypothetical protein
MRDEVLGKEPTRHHIRFIKQMHTLSIRGDNGTGRSHNMIQSSLLKVVVCIRPFPSRFSLFIDAVVDGDVDSTHIFDHAPPCIGSPALHLKHVSSRLTNTDH